MACTHNRKHSFEPTQLEASETNGATQGPSAELLREKALWHAWRTSGDTLAHDTLSAFYLPYTRALAAKCYARRIHNQFEFDEYFHFAVVGMMEAMQRFDPEREILFKTFCTMRINGAMLNGIDRLSEQQQQVALRRRLGRERVDSLSKEFSCTPENRLLNQLGEIGIGVALGFILEGTGMLAGAQDSLPDNAYSDIETKQLRQRMWQLVEQLTPREAQVIRLHYLQQQPFDEIGVALQLTKGRISQLHRQGLDRMRKLMENNGKLNLTL